MKVTVFPSVTFTIKACQRGVKMSIWTKWTTWAIWEGGEPEKNQDVKLDRLMGWGVGVGVSKCQAVAKDSISYLSIGSGGESQISEELALRRQGACCRLIGHIWVVFPRTGKMSKICHFFFWSFTVTKRFDFFLVFSTVLKKLCPLESKNTFVLVLAFFFSILKKIIFLGPKSNFSAILGKD